MTVSICPACGGSDLFPLIDFGRVPSTGVFLSNPTARFPALRLAFSYCRQCACIVQLRTEKIEVDYTGVGRGTQRQLPQYGGEIVADLVDLLGNDELLVEIGSNDGTFMTLLRDAGIRNMVGIEPSRSLAEKSRANGHSIENVALDQIEASRIRDLHGSAGAIVCRHTLEHVPDPLLFLRAARDLLAPNGVMFIEVPSVAPIIDQRLQSYELWDEHLTYFSETNLACLLVRAGLVIREIHSRAHCGSENILCWASVGGDKSEPARVTMNKSDVVACASFAERWRAFSEDFRKQASTWPRPICAMGASHPQTNFLNYVGVMPSIDGLFDDDSFKVGKWVPADTPVPIVASENIISRSKGGTVILSGFGYPQWMENVKQSLEETSIHIVDCGAVPK